MTGKKGWWRDYHPFSKEEERREQPLPALNTESLVHFTQQGACQLEHLLRRANFLQFFIRSTEASPRSCCWSSSAILILQQHLSIGLIHVRKSKDALCLETEHGNGFGAEEVGNGRSVLHPASRLARIDIRGTFVNLSVAYPCLPAARSRNRAWHNACTRKSGFSSGGAYAEVREL